MTVGNINNRPIAMSRCLTIKVGEKFKSMGFLC
jgi:hypothetical protein